MSPITRRRFSSSRKRSAQEPLLNKVFQRGTSVEYFRPMVLGGIAMGLAAFVLHKVLGVHLGAVAVGFTALGAVALIAFLRINNRVSREREAQKRAEFFQQFEEPPRGSKVE
ncbi:MAG: hypothetical protein O3A46_08435 [Candidatus Poribacteria bacterium]|nr:hypothetical protein [Candidatus Poribacteria bacterium]